MRAPHPMTPRRSTALFIAGLLTAFAATAQESYPSRNLTLMVPFPAGGTVDLLGRAVGQALGRHLGQTVITENKGGAGGTVGAGQVARAPADGYTLLLGSTADQTTAPQMLAKPPYDPARDFAPIGCISRSANVLVVNAKLPANNVAELIALAKSKPRALDFGSAGNGNTSHLSGELFGQEADVDIVHVPYRGNAPAITDTIGGQVQMLFSNPSSVMPHIKSGALRPLAVTSEKRMSLLPDVPTLREAGLPIDIYSFACVFVPAKTPAPIVQKLSIALTQALDDPDVNKALDAASADKFLASPEEARNFIAAERAKWGKVIRSRNIKAD